MGSLEPCTEDKRPEIKRSDMKELMKEYINTHTFVPLEHFACLIKEIEQEIQEDDMEAIGNKTGKGTVDY